MFLKYTFWRIKLKIKFSKNRKNNTKCFIFIEFEESVSFIFHHFESLAVDGYGLKKLGAMFPSIQPMLIHFLARKLWHIENLKFYFTLPSKEQDLETVKKFKSAIEDIQTNKVSKSQTCSQPFFLYDKKSVTVKYIRKSFYYLPFSSTLLSPPPPSSNHLNLCEIFLKIWDFPFVFWILQIKIVFVVPPLKYPIYIHTTQTRLKNLK